MRSVNYVLTTVKLNSAKAAGKAYKIADGGGLFVRISPAGTKTWAYSYAIDGKRTEVTFGTYPEVGIKAARDLHFAARTQLAAGVDPSAAKKEAKAERLRAAEAEAYVFRTFAKRWLDEKLASTSEDYRHTVGLRLELHVYPYIGKKALDEIKPRDVLTIMERLKSVPQTAEKARGHISQIFDYAILKLIVEANPARPMKGAVHVPPCESHRHLTEAELGTFWRALAARDNTETDPSTLAATRLIVWSMARKAECVNARWAEFDLDAGTWDIPKERMKMRKEHRVFLPRQAVEMLREQFYITGAYEHVFSSFGRRLSPISVTTIGSLFKRLEGVPHDFSPHGLRSTGATILRERGYRRDVVELLLAHLESGSARAYHRMELAPERRVALQAYADLIDALGAGGTNVVGINSRAA